LPPASAKNEEFLLGIARHGTAAHVEKVVSNYRWCKRLETLEGENRRHAHRELSWHTDGDGMWVLKGRFTAEQGALIEKAVEGAMGELFEEQRNEPGDVSAETRLQFWQITYETVCTSPPKPSHHCGAGK